MFQREDVARRAELKILAENYIIGLLTHPVEYIKPFFRIIPPESSFFSPELREVYKIIIEETPQELPLKSPSNHQTDFVEDDKIEKAFNHLRMRYKEKKLKAFPANLIRRLMNGAPNDFEKTATTLFHIAKEDRRARKLEELIRASRESDTETAEKISTELLEM